MALQLTPRPEAAKSLSNRVHKDSKELGSLLERMADKGDPQLPSQYTHTTKSEVLSHTLQREVLIRSAGNSLYIWLRIMERP